MILKQLVAALACLQLVAGCATPYNEVPLATNFPTSKQPKLQTAAHWNVIAGDVAKQISADLKDTRPLFVDQSSVKTTFDRAFTNDLISALVANGHTVMKSPDGALSVDVNTQTVRFSPNRPQHKHVGVATALATGVWALNGISLGTLTWEKTLGASAAVAAGADSYAWFQSEFATGETPQTEIIVTTSVSDASQYISRSTSIYYVADTDSQLYAHEPPYQAQTKVIGVTGK